MNKQKEEFDNDDSQNIDIHKKCPSTLKQVKKSPNHQTILHPKSLNTNSRNVTLTPEEFQRREQGLTFYFNYISMFYLSIFRI